MDRRTLIVAAAIAVAACGGDDDDGDAMTTTSTPTTADPTTTTTTAPNASYTVEPGDTLAEVAQRFGTTVEAIAEANDIADPDVIAVGQVLQIPPTP